MAVQTTKTNKPLNPRGQDQSPKGYNRAELYTGKALDFDGVNDWVDLDGFTMAGDVATIVFQAKFSNGNYMLDINTQRFVVLNDTTNGLSVYNSNAWAYYGDTDRAKIGFYAIVSDGTTQRAYYNGQQLGEDKTILAIDWDSITEMALGSNNNGTGNFFSGQIAGFKIFNTALTAAQVADLYNNPEKIVPTGVDNDALKLWLPMQEGAGTTAFNGAPDALGSNVVTNGTFDTDSDWTKTSGATISGGKANLTGDGSQFDSIQQNNVFTNGTTYLVSVDVTLNAGELKMQDGATNENIGAVTTSGKQAFIFTAGSNSSIVLGRRNASVAYNIDIDNVSVQKISNIGTISGATWTHGIGAPVAQTAVIDWNKYLLGGTTSILLPQGLTSGRDITGVNLFENVRKQGALNLDGNSWAEVHDNESLDFGTGEFTLEAWIKGKYVNQGSVFNAILTLGGGVTSANTAALMVLNNVVPYFIYSNLASLGTSQTEGDWVHIVGTYDETNTTLYVNGVQVDQDARTAADMTNGFVKVIGRDSTDPNRFYNDQIAQPRIYNRALTAEEVQRNYNAGKNTYTN